MLGGLPVEMITMLGSSVLRWSNVHLGSEYQS